MFKYTPPWQVMFHSLVSHTKTQTNNPQDVQSQAKGRIVSQTSPLQGSAPGAGNQLSRITMTSIPKQWVLKPLTPKLENSDLRTLLSPGSEPYSLESRWSFSQGGDFHSLTTGNIPVTQTFAGVINGEDFSDVVHAKQVAVSEDSSNSEDWQSSRPSSRSSINSADSHVGFYSFVDDPKSPEAEKNEIYMVSPQRQAKLSTLKEESRFKLQTYLEERRPEKLFQESNSDCQYYVGATSGEDVDEDQPNRIEIIRSQAPRKNAVFKEQWGALENLDLNKSPQNLVDGFSLCYSSLSTKPVKTEAEPGTIDNQQIDFNTARKQFQIMECKQNTFYKNPQPVNSSPKLQGGSLSTGAKVFANDLSKTETPKQNSWKRNMTMPSQEVPEIKSQNSLKNYADLGLDIHSVGSTSVDSLSTEPPMFDSTAVASMCETPIEREIRIAQEREEDLRRSRGIFLPDTTEMVEIKTKSIMSLPTPQIKPIKAKEPNRMSLFILREMIHQNSAHYDSGNLQDLQRRFFATLSDQIDPTSFSGDPRINFTGKTKDTSVTENLVNVEQRGTPDSEETLSPCCPHRHPEETIWRERTVGTYTNQWAEKQNSEAKTSNQPFWMADYKPEESQRTFAPMHNLSSSSSTENWKSLSSNEWPRTLHAPDLIRREIEESFRREQELQKLRETSNLSGTSEAALPSLINLNGVSGQRNKDQASVNKSYGSLIEVDAVLPHKPIQRTSYSSSSWNAEPTPVSSTAVSGPQSRLSSILTAQPWSGPKHSTPADHKPVPNLPSSPLSEISKHKSLSKVLPDDFTEWRVKLKLDESSYAGIQPIDDINHEVVEVTRVTRHKSTKALCWEAGVYANDENN